MLSSKQVNFIISDRNLFVVLSVPQIQLQMKKIKTQELQMEEEILERPLINNSTYSEETTSTKKSDADEARTRSTLLDHDPNKDKEVRKAKNAGKTFKRLFGYTLRNKSLLVVANVGLVISSGGMVLLPMLCGRMVDSIRANEDLVGGAIQFIILTILMAVFSAIRGFSFMMLGERIQVAMRQELFDKIIEKDISYYDKTKTGELLSRLGNDIATVYSVCSDNLSMLIRNFLQFLGSLVFLWVITWKLTLFIIVLTPIISFVLLIIMKFIKKLQKQYSNSLAFATSLATEVFGNIRVVRSFSNEHIESNNYSALLKKVFEVGRKKHMFYGVMLLVMTLFANFLILSILYFGGLLVNDGELSIGELTSFVLYTITLTVGFASLSGIMNQTISAIGICEHIFEIMDEPNKVISGIISPQFNNTSFPVVEFIDASFAYPTKENVEVLKHVNLKIMHGESIAIVGPSGSGKSSIVSLILRFYDLASGQIRIDGRDIKDINISALREKIGFVSQQPTLFSGSLRENVEYGLRQTVGKEQLVMQALEVANAKEFIFNQNLFPDKLDTLVGERGVKLSGGQKQRIAIARCLAKQPKIMIFDQATSALDAESEYQVQKAIDSLVNKHDRTMIIVAHRLSTIINCDRILVVKDGQIVEEGNHRQLLDRKGIYAHLVERQLSSS